MILPVTLVIAAAAGLINLWLALRTAQIRRAGGVELGDGGNQALLCRMRAHANFTEYAPTIVILLGLIELAHGASLWLWLAGIVFILGRLMHPFGLQRPGANLLRAGGIGLTWLVLLGLSIWAAVIGYSVATAAPAARPVIIGAPGAA